MKIYLPSEIELHKVILDREKGEKLNLLKYIRNALWLKVEYEIHERVALFFIQICAGR